MIARAMALLIIALTPLALPAGVAAKGDGVLIMRFGWAPGFCYSGSASQVPRELCGFSGSSQQRFWAHRVLRIVWAGADGKTKDACPDPTPGYSPSALPPAVRATLDCVGNAYTPGKTDDWNKYLWEQVGTCVAAAAGLSAGDYFGAMVDAYSRYNIDSALRKAGYALEKGGTIEGKALVATLTKAFGKKGFYSCNPGTKSVYSTYSICLTPTAPHRITDCPAKFLKPNTKCPAKMKINLEHGGPVSKSCLPYYPAFK